MEPITQGLLGAAVGQTVYAHRLGRRALVWGALIGMLPDLDVIVAPLHGGFGELLYHRGSTHALWFGPVVGPPLGWLLWRWRDGRESTRAAWMGLAVLALFTHPLLDVFTTYGTQLFAPFWRERFAWNGVGIIDPFYSMILAVAVFVGSRARTPARAVRSRRVAAFALGLSTGYLLVGVGLNQWAERDVRAVLEAQGASEARVRVYPTVFQPFLRRVVVRTPDEVRVGLHTPFRPGEPYWRAFAPPPEHPLVRDLEGTWEGALFVWFAMEQTTAHTRPRPGPAGGTTVEIEDLRYALPGMAADKGLWGIRAHYAANGRRVGPVVRYNRRRVGRVAPLMVEMWNATWGDFSGLPRGL